MFPTDSLDEKLTALRRHWAAVDASAANQLAAQRESIAAGIEALGCTRCWSHREVTLAPMEHLVDCPVVIAAGVREGRIG